MPKWTTLVVGRPTFAYVLCLQDYHGISMRNRFDKTGNCVMCAWQHASNSGHSCIQMNVYIDSVAGYKALCSKYAHSNNHIRAMIFQWIKCHWYRGNSTKTGRSLNSLFISPSLLKYAFRSHFMITKQNEALKRSLALSPESSALMRKFYFITRVKVTHCAANLLFAHYLISFYDDKKSNVTNELYVMRSTLSNKQIRRLFSDL